METVEKDAFVPECQGPRQQKSQPRHSLQRRNSNMPAILRQEREKDSEEAANDVIMKLQSYAPSVLYGVNSLVTPPQQSGTQSTPSFWMPAPSSPNQRSSRVAEQKNLVRQLYHEEHGEEALGRVDSTSSTTEDDLAQVDQPHRRSFKGAARRVMFMNRMTRQAARNMQVWRRARGRDEREAWHDRIFFQDSPLVCAIHIMVTFMSVVDIGILMIESTGHHGCSQECRDHGGPFNAKNRQTPTGEPVRGYLGPSFLACRITLGLCSDLVYLVHFVIRTRTAPHSSIFKHKMRKRDIALQYLRSRVFLGDVVGCLPFFWLGCESPWCRLNRLVNILLIGMPNEEVQKWVLACRLHISMKTIELLKHVFSLIFYVHFMTCATMLVAWSWILPDHPGDETEVERWLDIADSDKADMDRWDFFYLHCSLWVFSNVSGLGGNWSPHTAITSGWTYVNQCIGVFLYMYLFGEIVSILHEFDLASAEFQALRNKMDTFLQIRQVPTEMQERVRSYLDELWQLKHGVEERDALEKLPSFLRNDIRWFLNQQFLEKLPMFFGANMSMILEVNRRLVSTVAPEGELVCRKDELSQEMHFVLSGEIHILDEDGKPDLELFDGSIVGEVSLVFDIPSPHDAQVVATSHLFTLSADDFFQVALTFPAFLRRMDNRGHAVYGEKWSEWHSHSEHLDNIEGAPLRMQEDLRSRNDDKGRRSGASVSAAAFQDMIRSASESSQMHRASSSSPLPVRAVSLSSPLVARTGSSNSTSPLQYNPRRSCDAMGPAEGKKDEIERKNGDLLIRDAEGEVELPGATVAGMSFGSQDALENSAWHASLARSLPFVRKASPRRRHAVGEAEERQDQVVQLWLERLQQDDAVRKTFAHNMIDLEALQQCSEMHLEQLGMSELGARLKLLKWAKAWTPTSC